MFCEGMSSKITLLPVCNPMMGSHPVASSSSKDCELYFKAMLLCRPKIHILSSTTCWLQRSYGQLRKMNNREPEDPVLCGSKSPWCGGLKGCRLNQLQESSKQDFQAAVGPASTAKASVQHRSKMCKPFSPVMANYHEPLPKGFQSHIICHQYSLPMHLLQSEVVSCKVN
jgi:hypothetical protein